MSSGFRLLAVDQEFDSTTADFPFTTGQRKSFQVAPSHTPMDANWVTVLTGPNGLGKSRALAAIAAIFSNAQYVNARARHKQGDYWRLSYTYDGHYCEVWLGRGRRLVSRRNGLPHPADALPLPQRVIALATTATDKFPISRAVERDGNPDRDEIYHYLGLKDRTGRASATSGVQRALEGLMEATKANDQRRRRISDVFALLGYTPRVVHTYRWRYAALRYGQEGVEAILDRPNGGAATAARLRQMITKDPAMAERIGVAVAELADGRMTLSFTADFEKPQTDELENFHYVQLLRRAGLLSVSSIELERIDTGMMIDLREVSSGELSMATAFLGLAAVIEDDSLILIDEPEVSLHPEWQAQYLKLLTDVFSIYRGCHFVIATHSPLVVSGISPDFANVISLDPQHRGSSSGSDYSGESIDEVLVREFGVISGNNLYVKQSLVHAIRLAADGMQDTREFDEALQPLIPVLDLVHPDSATRQLIDQLLQAREGSHR